MRGRKYIKQLNDCESELMMLEFLMNLEKLSLKSVPKRNPNDHGTKEVSKLQGVTKAHVSLDTFIIVKLVQKSVLFLYNFIIFILKLKRRKQCFNQAALSTILRQSARFG